MRKTQTKGEGGLDEDGGTAWGTVRVQGSQGATEMEVSPEERTEWTGEVGGMHLEGLKGSGDLVLYLGACRKPQVRA